MTREHGSEPPALGGTDPEGDPGSGIAGYERLTKIGRGGTATVHRSVRRADGATVAVKIFDDGETAAHDRQLRAAELLDGVPGVLPTWADGTTADGRRFTVSPYMVGGSLSDHMSGQPAMAPDRVATLGTQLAEALAAAHAAGVLHRDLKPSNVLLDDRGSAQLADFGAATFLPGATSSATMAITLLYAAPEVLEGAAADERSDIYSLGLTLLAAATGRNPFGDPGEPGPAGVAAIVNRICSTGVPEDSLDALPDGLAAVLRTATQLDPADRFLDAASMSDALRHVQADPDLVPLGTTARRHRRRRGRRRSAVLGAAAAALAVAVAGGTVLLLDRPDDVTESLGPPITERDDRLGPLYEQDYARYVGMLEPGCGDDERLVELAIHAGPGDMERGVSTPWDAVDGEGAGTFMSYMPCDTGIDQARYLLGATGRWFVLVAEFPEDQYERMSGWMRENENSPSPDFTVDDEIRATLADPESYRGWAIIDQEAE